MTDTTGSINAKGLEGTGFTEDLVAEHFNKVGAHLMAVVDLQVVDRHGPNVKGKRKVSYVIDNIEPALDEDLAEHLRELQRGAYYERGLREGQQAIDDELAPKVKDVIGHGHRHKPHPFTPVPGEDENPICDVCGVVEDASSLHSDKARNVDPFEVPDDEDQGDDVDEDQDEEDGEVDMDDPTIAEDWVDSQHGDKPEDPDDGELSYEPHAFVDTGTDGCGYHGCSQPSGAAVHTVNVGLVTT